MQMRQYRLLSPMIKVVIVLFSLLFSTAQAGLVIGGTRFAYPENQSSISVELKNTSDRDMLVKVAVSPDDARQLTGTVEYVIVELAAQGGFHFQRGVAVRTLAP